MSASDYYIMAISFLASLLFVIYLEYWVKWTRGTSQEVFFLPASFLATTVALTPLGLCVCFGLGVVAAVGSGVFGSILGFAVLRWFYLRDMRRDTKPSTPQV